MHHWSICGELLRLHGSTTLHQATHTSSAAPPLNLWWALRQQQGPNSVQTCICIRSCINNSQMNACMHASLMSMHMELSSTSGRLWRSVYPCIQRTPLDTRACETPRSSSLEIATTHQLVACLLAIDLIRTKTDAAGWCSELDDDGSAHLVFCYRPVCSGDSLVIPSDIQIDSRAHSGCTCIDPCVLLDNLY